MLNSPSDVEFENVVRQMVMDMREPGDGGVLQDFGVMEVREDISQDNFRSFAKADGASMIAVDGGSATILDAGSFVVAAIRVGSVFYRGREFIPGTEPEMHLLHLSISELSSA